MTVEIAKTDEVRSLTFQYIDQDDVHIFVYKWEPVDVKPIAVIQISHGMAEHAKRYERAAMEFVKAGFIVYADDHRGHGLSAGDLTEDTLEGNAGVLGPNGWKGTTNSIHELTNIIKKENPNIPLFLLGHSWGSFMSQHIIQKWSVDYKGVILSGTNGRQNKMVMGVGKKLAKAQLKKIGPTAPCELLDGLSFKAYNKKWKKEPDATPFEWLSRDKSEVLKYVDDPWSGFVCPAPFFIEMLNMFEKIWDEVNEAKISNDLPILFISGELDPVSRELKDLRPLVERYKTNGIKDISTKFYTNARHEIFNEINRYEVYNDVIEWLRAHL